jgi:hypothetical protein
VQREKLLHRGEYPSLLGHKRFLAQIRRLPSQVAL